MRLAADTLPGKRIAAVGLAVIGFGAVLVGLAALILAAARGGRAEERPAPDPAPERLVGLLQTPLPGDAGLRTRAEGAAWLERWSWVDRERGLVRLPIDLAIARLLAGEVPAGVPVPTAPGVPPAPPPGPDADVDPRGKLGRGRGGREDGP